MINEPKCLEELIEFSFREVSVKQIPMSLEKEIHGREPNGEHPQGQGPKESSDGSKQDNHRDFLILEG